MICERSFKSARGSGTDQCVRAVTGDLKKLSITAIPALHEQLVVPFFHNRAVVENQYAIDLFNRR
jgi:hypothetical protein